MAHFILRFNGTALTETRFSHPLIRSEAVCVRGRTGGATPLAGSFPWSAGPQGLSTLILRTVGSRQNEAIAPILAGDRGSLAASLDYAIDKQPIWIQDMLGLDGRGQSIAKRLISRTNASRKWPGPVLLSVNTAFLDVDCIVIEKNGSRVTDESVISHMLMVLESAQESDLATGTTPARILAAKDPVAMSPAHCSPTFQPEEL